MASSWSIGCHDHLRGRLKELDDSLRAKGFTIQPDGEHDPQNGIEGSSTFREASFLCKAVQRAVANSTTLASDRPFRVCQTGFNRGRSAVAFLAAHSAVTVASFDLGAHAYVDVAHRWIDREYPGRHSLFLGNSAVGIPKAPASIGLCVFVFVDGGHAEGIALSDIYEFGRRAAAGAPMYIDDCPFQPMVAAAFQRACDQRVVHCQRTLD
eukprot:128673-Prymnesium_polylepis.1